MAKLLRLHLTSVGHKDARFFPLTLDFRRRDGTATDNVVWLRNGGGKSSLLNLFYSTFLPESRKFLGSKAETRDRRLTDYVKASDLACIVSEWEMPAGANLFSSTRIVGQVLAWKNGVCAPGDEERLDREFFTFRGSPKVPFDSLPIHGLSLEPKQTLQAFREWLAQLSATHRELEVERGNEGKTKWRQRLDSAGFDTELFSYQLTMNIREGGAAELFKVRDTMEFIDLFLEMALHPIQAEKTADQIEAVREKLRKLPQRELEERFIVALLGELRPLAEEAAVQREAARNTLAQRQANHLLHAAIENSIALRRARIVTLQADIVLRDQDISTATQAKQRVQEYRLNYDHLARTLTWREAKATYELSQAALQTAAIAERIAEAAIRFFEISSQQEALDALLRQQEKFLVDQKPHLDELNACGADLCAALDSKISEAAEQLDHARKQQAQLQTALQKADADHKQALQQRATAQSELHAVSQRLVQRDRRRADLRDSGIIMPKEKAVDALVRWQFDETEVLAQIAGAEARNAAITSEQQAISELSNEQALEAQRLDVDADALHARWQHGEEIAGQLRSEVALHEVTASDTPDLDFPDLPALLSQRAGKLLDAILQTRLDGEEDRRTLRSIETERLFPPSREVEFVVEYLRARGVASAMPAYRFLATNTPTAEAASDCLTHDPARYSGVFVGREAEFSTISGTTLSIAGLRHPVIIALSELPADTMQPPRVAVAMPALAGAYHYASAADSQRTVEDRIDQLDNRITTLQTSHGETTEAASRLSAWRRDFGSGALARIAIDRDQLRDRAARIREQIAAFASQRSALESEQAGLTTSLREFRSRIISITKAQQRLSNYIEDHERHERAWIEERDTKQVLLLSLEQQISDSQATLQTVGADLEAARLSVQQHQQAHTDLERERQAVVYNKSPLPAVPSPLEGARATYRTTLARFEERFGRDKLDWQIEEKQILLQGLRETHSRASSGLEAGEIQAASLLSDLPARQHAARRAHLAANSAQDAAAGLLKAAEENLPPPPAHKQGLGLPPDAIPPETAQAAIECRDELDLEIASISAKLSEYQQERTSLLSQSQTLEASVTARDSLLLVLAGITSPTVGVTSNLPDDDSTLSELVRDAKQSTEKLGRIETAANLATQKRIDTLLDITRDSAYAALPSTARDRFLTLDRTTIPDRCHEFIAGYDSRRLVLRNEIEKLAEDKEIVVRQLDGVATAALRLLGQAERASIMPDAFPGWTGQPFLRITSQTVTEPAVRRDRLAALVDRLVNDRAIPRGSSLASAAVREIGGHIRVTLLKPEDPLRPDRHDITEFGTFSGGEKMTAAILLYVTLAQLRSRGRHETSREHVAGVLILDNPLGTASKREFVELQLRVARQMGVQLIFTTGVNDLGALEVLPRILRLRKRHRDARSGDLLLSQETPEEHVESVQANLRPA